MILSDASLNVKNFKLKKPYVLSFATIESLSSIQLTLEINKQYFTAEVVPLLGYNDESEANIVAFLTDWISKSKGGEISELRSLAKEKVLDIPFSVSPILQAIDLCLIDFKPSDNTEDISFVVPISNQDILNSVLDPNIDYKLKLSGDIQTDIKSLNILKEKYPSMKVRTDANQIFKRKEAFDFFTKIEKDNLQQTFHYVEQPVLFSDWTLIQELKEEFPNIPLMLDESVISNDHIEKAKSIGVEFIKLKLFKQGGIQELIEQSKLINDLEMKVVIGNGVATSMSNSIENTIYNSNQDLFFGASEANGFLKV